MKSESNSKVPKVFIFVAKTVSKVDGGTYVLFMNVIHLTDKVSVSD